jgi:Predicted xylanase/chitin deacetylase
MAETAKKAWLTIDDAPTEDFRQRVDELNARGIRAVWFCLGELLERYPEEAAYAVRSGHILGNHSYDHPAFSKIALAEAREQIERTERLLDGIYAKAGVPRPVKLFRFPYLDDGGDGKRDALQSLLRDMGFEQPGFPGVTYAWWREKGWPERIDAGCTYDTWDWRLQEGEEMLPKLLARMDEREPEHGRGLNEAPGSNEVILMHAWIPMDAFRVLLDRLQTKPLLFEPPVQPDERLPPGRDRREGRGIPRARKGGHSAGGRGSGG